MDKKTNIVLIGMPGCGKSTLGVLTAKALGLGFVDTDLVIQHKTGRMLYKIVEQDGKDAFLDVERDSIVSTEFDRCVVATGGSAVLREQTMEHLKKNGVVVYLELPYYSVKRRIKNIKTRGIAFGEGETLADLYRERCPLYEKYADIVIACSGKNTEQNVSDIVEKVKDLVATE